MFVPHTRLPTHSPSLSQSPSPNSQGYKAVQHAHVAVVVQSQTVPFETGVVVMLEVVVVVVVGVVVVAAVVDAVVVYAVVVDADVVIVAVVVMLEVVVGVAVIEVVVDVAVVEIKDGSEIKQK